MKIVVTHLTRMQAGFFCVAGVNVWTGKHVRCVTDKGRLPVEFLSTHGGPFDMARIIVLNGAKHCPETPHTEDHVIDPSGVRSVPNVGARWFWRLLRSRSWKSLTSIFGRELLPVGPWSCATLEGRGTASLGLLRPRQAPELKIRKEAAGDHIRMKMHDKQFTVIVSVTDVRLYNADHVTPNRRVVQMVTDAIERGVAVVLSVGLTRAFHGYHWLQVNNIHLESDPTWRLGSAPVV